MNFASNVHYEFQIDFAIFFFVVLLPAGQSENHQHTSVSTAVNSDNNNNASKINDKARTSVANAKLISHGFFGENVRFATATTWPNVPGLFIICTHTYIEYTAALNERK